MMRAASREMRPMSALAMMRGRHLSEMVFTQHSSPCCCCHPACMQSCPLPENYFASETVIHVDHTQSTFLQWLE
jgi:hypothetical protein